MKSTMSATLAATLIATAVGLIFWFFGFARSVWPAHPQLAGILATVITGVAVSIVWPAINRNQGI